MRAPAVIKGEIAADRGARLGNAGIGAQVDFLVLDRPPEALDEDVVAPGALAIHADGDLGGGQDCDEADGGELAALVGVEDARPAMPGQSFLERLDAEIRAQCDRQPPGEDLAAVPVDDGREIDEAARHRYVGDVHRPDLVWPGHRQVAQEVRVDLVPRRWLRGPRAAIERLDAHRLHQRRHVEPAHLMAFGHQHSPEHPAAGERVVEVQLVDPAHEREIGGGRRPRQVVDAASADPERLRLAADAEAVGAVDHRFALANRPALPSAPDKKSFSSVSSPIFACSVFTSTTGAASVFAAPPNTPEAPSRSCVRHWAIWFGCTSYCWASSASVFSPLMAATATFALKAGLWFRRGRLVMVAPRSLGNHADLARTFHSAPLFKILRATSDADALVLAGPAIAGGDALNPIYRVGGWALGAVAPDKRWTGAGIVEIHPTDNREALRRVSRDPRHFADPSSRELFGLVLLMDEAAAAAPAVHMPTLTLMGAHDEVLRPDRVRRIHARIPGAVDFGYYPDGWHWLFSDLQAERVWKDVADFAGCAGSPPASSAALGGPGAHPRQSGERRGHTLR